MPDKAVNQPKKEPGFAESTFQLYNQALHRYLMRRLRRRESADDLAQEVYLRLLRVDNAELVRQPLAYLYKVASHVVYDWLKEDNERVTFDSDAAEYGAEHPQDYTRDETGTPLITADELNRALAQLPPTYRAVLLLRKRDGMSHAEIAKELGISIHTVKKYVRLAAAQCRFALWQR